MFYNVFAFPDDAQDTNMDFDGDSYIATWTGSDGKRHCEILDPEEVETVEWQNAQLPDDALQYYSDDGYYYRD